MQWRCHDCFGEPVFCTSCIQARHSTHPFHRISRWEGICFTRSSLAKAGLTLNLGHGGNLCPRYLIREPASASNATPTRTKSVSALGIRSFQDGPKPSQPDFRSAAVHPFPADNISFPLPTATLTGLTTSTSSTLPVPTIFCPPDEIDLFFSSSSQLSQDSSRFWEVDGSIPYEKSPLKLHPQPPVLIASAAHTHRSSSSSDSRLLNQTGPAGDLDNGTTIVFGDIDTSNDPFFANGSEEEDEWKSIETGGVPVKTKKRSAKLDNLHCPMLTIVDITGVHELRTRFCRCHDLKDNPLHKQLLNIGLYPASTERTRTVFTFRVLDHFDLTNLEGKIPSYAYYRILKRLTANTFPDMVPDRYRELMRCLRQWRDLQSRRRAGYPLESISSLKPGGLALFCPACPQPGINLPEGWEDDPKKYVHASR